MKKIINLVIRLLLIAAFSALILGFVNKTTSPIIEERTKKLMQDSYSVVYPSGKDFKSIESSVNENIKEIIEVSDGSSVVGYIFSVSGKGGYGGDVNYMVGVSKEGIIQGFTVISHAETKGYGAAVTEDTFTNGVKEVNISKGVSYGSGNKDTGEIQAISGATRTTKAVVNGLTAVQSKMSELSDLIQPAGEEKIPYNASFYKELFADADSFKEVKDPIYEKSFIRLIEAYKGQDKLGLIAQTKQTGFGGDINLLTGIDKDKNIVSFKIVSHSESPDYGANIESQVYLENIVGKSLASNIKLKSKPTRSKDILVISGASITSVAMKDALNDIVVGLKKYDKLSQVNSEDLDIAKINSEEQVVPAYDHVKLFTGIDRVEAIEGAKLNAIVVNMSKAFSGDKEVGTIIDLNNKGFGGVIELGLLVDSNGVVKQYVLYKHGESEDYGNKIEKKSYVDKIVGQKLEALKSDVVAISGATVTTGAMNAIFDAAREAFSSLAK